MNEWQEFGMIDNTGNGCNRAKWTFRKTGDGLGLWWIFDTGIGQKRVKQGHKLVLMKACLDRRRSDCINVNDCGRR